MPGVWGFTINLAQIFGGIFTPIAIFIAIWNVKSQIQAAREIEKEKLANEGKLAAARMLGEMSGFCYLLERIRPVVNNALYTDDIQWQLDSSNSIHILTEVSKPVFEEILVLSRHAVEEVFSNEDVFLFAREDQDVLEKGIIFNGSFDTLKFYTLNDMSHLTSNDYAARLLNGLVLLVWSGAKLMDWVHENYGFSTPVYPLVDGASHGDKCWPQKEDLVNLAMVNPPVSWGGWENIAGEAWSEGGNATELPVRK